jgi:hypothetical protein
MWQNLERMDSGRLALIGAQADNLRVSLAGT